MAPDGLAGIHEIAKLFGITKATALSYTRHPKFPRPADRLASGPVWVKAKVEAWGAKYLVEDSSGKRTLPRSGRPPKSRE